MLIPPIQIVKPALSTLLLKWCFFIFLFPLVASGQPTIITGQVTGKKGGEPIPYVNIRIAGTHNGTTSDLNGNFRLTATANDTLVFSAVGFRKRYLQVESGEASNLTVELEAEVFALREIEVRPGENPANIIFRKIIAAKKENDQDNFPSWQSKIYTKSVIDIKNMGKSLKNDRLTKDFGFVFNYVDTTEIQGTRLLPVFMTETVSEFYHDSETNRDAEIVTAHKASGVNSDMLARYTGKLYEAINIYDNTLVFSDVGMISPLSTLGLQYYRYYLLDSISDGDRKIYELSFQPKLRQEPVFVGKMWVEEESWALTKIEMKLNEQANVNFINAYQYQAEFSKHADRWVLQKESLLVDFDMKKEMESDKPGFLFRKFITHEEFRHTDVLPVIRSMKERIGLEGEVIRHTDQYWDGIRPDTLQAREAGIYKMVDSVMSVPRYDKIAGNLHMLFTGYRDLGKFELGPWYYLYSKNIPEGNRFRLGGRTTWDFNKYFRLHGYAAYGTKDKEWKYGGGVQYWFSNRPLTVVSLQGNHDMEMLGKSISAFSESNIMTTVLGKGLISQLNMTDRIELTAKHEWRTGVSNELSIAYGNILSSPLEPFKDLDGQEVPSLTSGELRFGFRYAPGEDIVVDEFERTPMDYNHPILNVGLNAGMKGFLGGEYNFLYLKASLYDKIPVYPMGYGTCLVQAGKIFGNVPYPFLKIHEGNETYIFDSYAFNMMKYQEFVSDTYLSLSYEHHFQGFFLNKLPLLRKLKWREVAGVRALAGSFDHGKHNSLQLPVGMKGLSRTPYTELSAGVENILKFFRVDAVWRFNYNDAKKEKLGIFLSIDINL